MTVVQFLSQLRQSGIHLWVEDHQLRVRAAKTQLTTELREQLAARKPEILAFLGAMPSTAFAPIPQASRQGSLPLSFAQERLWFLAEFEPTSTAYGIFMASRLAGELDGVALERSLAEVIRRHEALRTTFKSVEGKPVQNIAAPGEFTLAVTDLSGCPPAEREGEAQRWLARRCQQVFDLASGPLFEATLLRLDAVTHLLLLRVHHVVFDGWSAGVLRRELSELYAAWHAGRAPGLAPLPVQYADFARWQRQWLLGEELARQTAYWRESLREAPVLELPLDRPRPATLTYAGARHSFRLPRNLADRLRAFNQEAEATPFMSLLAAFNVLLSRYSGGEDIVVGTPIANRLRPELEGMIGFFVNTLAIRCNLSGEPDFRELVRRVRATALDAFQHQDLPFEKLVAELNPVREQNRHPLFQVMLAVQNVPLHPLVLPGLEVSPCPLPGTTTHFDLELYLSPEGDSWLGEWVYNTDLFEASTMGRMAGHYQMLLDRLLQEPDRPVSQLPMLSDAERLAQAEWNATPQDFPRDKCVHQLFEEQAARTPDAVAVVFEGSSLTYRELNQQANRLAQHLRDAGVGPETLVGICLERSSWMVTGVLAILKAGGAYVPLDPAFPADRLQYMIAAAKMAVILTQESLVSSLPPHQARIVNVEAIQSGGQPMANLASLAQPENLAYVLFTSGSTGHPKGVEIPHRAMVNFLTAMRQRPGLEPTDVLVAVTTLSFDIAGLELFLPLTVGARVVVARREAAAEGRQLLQLLKESGATVMQATPVTWRLLLAAGWEGQPRLKVLVGGEAVPQELADTLARLGTSAWNLYGPTETTVWSTVHPLQAGEEVRIGRPINNTQVQIVNSGLEPVPVGVAGELLIGGEGLARGYLNQPEQTTARFILQRSGNLPGARWYRTGDLARWRTDGNIEYLGRLDRQVKLRGFRIELGEIESVLGTCPDVAACAVVVQGKGEEKQLAAFLVMRNGSEMAVPALRAWLGNVLPDYMIPSRFTALEALPLTPNRKVDRRALESMAATRIVAGEHVAPRTELEHQLTVLWNKSFERGNIGVDDNFFHLGGHSLQAVRLAAEMDKLLGRKLPIAVMFQAPTIALLARWLVEKDWAPMWSSLVPLQPAGNKPPLFLVHGWGGDVYGYLNLVRQLPPDQPVYGIQAMGVDGKAERHITVEAMAAHYVKEILSFQPKGPYYLGGYSMGGLIAYEVARQLAQHGRQTALLALLDSAPVGRIPWLMYARVMIPEFGRRICFHLRRWWKMPVQDRLTYLRGRWKAFQIRLGRNRAKAPPVTVPPKPDSQPPKVPGFADYYYAIATTYLVRRYPGSAEVFVADNSGAAIGVWKYLAQEGAAFHRIPGNHHEIMLSPEHVPVLARALTGALHRAQRKSPAPINPGLTDASCAA